MTPELTPCSACEQLVVAGTCVCPHCGHKKPCTTLISRSAALLGLSAALAGSIGCLQDMYGVAMPPVPDEPDRPAETAEEPIDADGDGYSADEDCNDDDAAVHPGATETPGDKLDSNCDGNDDT